MFVVPGNMDAAKEVLRVTFEQNPSGATFSMFQRFIRRTLGIAAARRMFSETNAMRASNPKIALEVGLMSLVELLCWDVDDGPDHCPVMRCVVLSYTWRTRS